MARLLDSLFGPLAHCAECGRAVRERRRHPCPSCGALARVHGRTATDSITSEDKGA